MLADAVEFLPDIQSINSTENTDFVLFCSTKKAASSLQQQLFQDFNIDSILDIDNYGAQYVIPLGNLDEKIISNFICRGWQWDRNQNFVQYLITLYTEDSANKIYNILIAKGYNIVLSENNLQIIVKCLSDSPNNTELQKLKCELEAFEQSHPKSIDDYFNKVLFNGVIENTQYRKLRKQEFDIDAIKKNKDLIIRGILHQYFNKTIRPLLFFKMLPKKFDANRLKNETIQEINLVRDFLYSVTAKYIDTQINQATKNHAIIRFDYLKKCSEYDNFKNVLKLAKAWQHLNAKNDRIKKRDIRLSQRWAYKLMDLNNGYYVVYLGAQEALNYEKHKLKYGAMVFYNNDIYEGFTRYSIRKDYKPIVTLDVHNNTIVRCYGYENTIPCDKDLREAVRMFMHERNLTIPNTGWNKLIAYKKQNGTLFDIFDLPKNFILDEGLNLEKMTLDELPEMSTVSINGNLLCYKNNLSNLSGAPYKVAGYCDFSQNPLVSLYGMPRKIGGMILLSGHKLTADSFVPLYLEEKLNTNDVLGVNKDVLEAWKKQIALRKTGLSNIIASLSETKNK